MQNLIEGRNKMPVLFISLFLITAIASLLFAQATAYAGYPAACNQPQYQ